jgi:hypothetical protein
MFNIRNVRLIRALPRISISPEYSIYPQLNDIDFEVESAVRYVIRVSR